MVKRILLLCALTASLARAQPPEVAPTAAAPAPALVAPPVEEPAPKPITKRPLFWVAIVGGVAVAVAGITLAVVLNPPHDPTATWGVGNGN
jgi:hypothetical protein